MRLPLWTAYPALAMLGTMLVAGIPRPLPADPYAGAAAAARAGALASSSLSSSAAAQDEFPRFVVLGIDGLDPEVLSDVIQRFPERMPNFRALIAEGDGIHSLGTSTPPQSPVAWSNFITGRDPGGHGIYDFIHRDPVHRTPLPSTTKSEPVEVKHLPGRYRFPLGGTSESNRTGLSFWRVLADNGVPADVWRMPANFPVEPAQGLSFPGMMAPALDSAYGEYTFYTTNPPIETSVNGGKIETVSVYDGRIDTRLIGPENSFVDPLIDSSSGTETAERGTLPLIILIDEESRSALIDLGHDKILLEEGEWSGFKAVTFDLLPMGLMPMGGTVRFYLRSVAPEFELYASPINIDPLDPATPVSEPESASADLADRTTGIGLYYTQGMAEEVNALKAEVLSVPEFMQQTQLVYSERRRMMDYAVEHYLDQQQGGLLFFYYSTVDLTGHMAWSLFDDSHPFHDAELAAQDSSDWSGREGSTWKDVIYDLYMQMDPVLGQLRERIGQDTALVVMSDHGFAPYKRTFSLNTWLYDNGYLVLREGREKELSRDQPAFRSVNIAAVFDDDGDPQTAPVSVVDWERTRAYGIGFNGLYLNLEGREGCDSDGNLIEGADPGSVAVSEVPALLAELKQKLEAVRDPQNGGKQVVVRADITSAHDPSSIYRGERVSEAPDIQVGYNTDYENSEQSTLGGIPHDILEDNLGGSFMGSHLMAPELVAGTLLTNRPLRPGPHALEDLTVEILAFYGIDPIEGMIGHRVLQDTP